MDFNLTVVKDFWQTFVDVQIPAQNGVVCKAYCLLQNDCQFYIYDEERYVDADSLLFFQSNIQETKPYTQFSTRTYALNTDLAYDVSKEIGVNLFLALQNSQAQGIFNEVGPITQTQREVHEEI